MGDWDTKIMCEFDISVIEARLLDTVSANIKNSKILIDVVIFEEFCFRNKEAEKMSKYQDFTLKIY